MVEAVDINNLAAKTPVSLLQELFVKKGIIPKYDLIQIEGAIHEPTFKYRVTVGDLVAAGSGQSKKKAKHCAAKAVLDKIIGAQKNGHFLNGDNPLSLSSEPVISPYDDGIPGNPVGSLQEVCISHRWAPPVYILAGEHGLPHERQFSLTCVVENHHEVGVGKSKKLAKRQAAYKMLLRLKDEPYEPANPTTALEDEDEITQKAAARFAGLKDSKIQTLSVSQSQKVSQFHRNLRTRTGELLSSLHTTAFKTKGFDYVNFLESLSKEQNFEVTHVEIEELSLSGDYQCLVQLSTFPVAVCYGAGANPGAAKSAAALNALEYLRIMTSNK